MPTEVLTLGLWYVIYTHRDVILLDFNVLDRTA